MAKTWEFSESEWTRRHKVRAFFGIGALLFGYTGASLGISYAVIDGIKKSSDLTEGPDKARQVARTLSTCRGLSAVHNHKQRAVRIELCRTPDIPEDSLLAPTPLFDRALRPQGNMAVMVARDPSDPPTPLQQINVGPYDGTKLEQEFPADKPMVVDVFNIGVVDFEGRNLISTHSTSFATIRYYGSVVVNSQTGALDIQYLQSSDQTRTVVRSNP